MKKDRYIYLRYNLMFFSISAAIGFFCGYSSVALRKLIVFLRSFFLDSNETNISFIVDQVNSMRILSIITICGLLVGTISYFLAREAKGYGVIDVLVAVKKDKSIIKPRIIFIKTITTALTISSGGSAGEQGPVVQIGAAIGSAVGQFLRFSHKRLKTLVACGAAGGIAAAFNAPIAGMIFALDVILGEFKMLNVSAVAISSVTATMVSWKYLGNDHIFNIPQIGSLGMFDMIFAIIIGVFCAVSGHLFFKILTGFESLFENINVHYILKPAIGAFLTGLIIIYLPQMYGGGYDVMNAMVEGTIPFWLVVLYGAVKILSTSLTLGSGGSGGLFAPSIFIGGSVGSAVGIAIQMFFPSVSSPLGVYVMLGMAGLIAAIMHSPLTGFLIIFEMANNYDIILPLMITVVLASLISSSYSPYSAYTKKLSEKGIKLFSSKDEKLLDGLTVREYMIKNYITFEENMTFQELSLMIHHSSQLCFPVIDNLNCIKGTIMISQIIDEINNGNSEKTAGVFLSEHIDEIAEISAESSLNEAIFVFNKFNLLDIPVTKDRKVIGLIRQKDILKAYRQNVYESLLNS